MLFLTRLKVLLKRKSTIFWILVFPILLASAEYFAFGKFISSTPIETISIGVIKDETPILLLDIFKEAKIEEQKPLYELIEYQTIEDATKDLENKKIDHYVYKKETEIKIISNQNSTNLSITASLIHQVNRIEDTIEDAYQSYLASGKNPEEVNVKEIIENLTKEVSYFKDTSTSKTATFYTFYFYALLAMSCLYAALLGVGLIQDIRADRSSLGIRIASSVVSKPKLVVSYFGACGLLQVISSCILYVYFTYILHISLGEQPLLILLTLILGSLAGITIGMLIGVLVKGGEAKAQGIVTAVTLSLSCLAGLMSVEVKHFVDHYMSFINWLNPASLITNSLYALYYYDTYTNYILYSCILFGISFLAIIGVLLKTRGETYASL